MLRPRLLLRRAEPASRASLERGALFARKAAASVGARFEAQGWAWRDASVTGTPLDAED